jgi:hypothetical protein
MKCPKCGKLMHSKAPGVDGYTIIYCNSSPYGCGYKEWIKIEDYDGILGE